MHRGEKQLLDSLNFHSDSRIDMVLASHEIGDLQIQNNIAQILYVADIKIPHRKVIIPAIVHKHGFYIYLAFKI